MEHVTIEQILACLDGALDPATGDSVRRHLDECPACTREAALQRSIGASARRALEVEAGPVFEAKLMQALNVAPATPARRRFEFSIGNVLYAGFLACLAGMAVFMFLNTTPSSTPGRPAGLAHQTFQTISSWGQSAGAWMHGVLEPLRLQSDGSRATAILVILPVLIVLFFLDRLIPKLMQRS
jgi:anti-sigma factor RsiW